MTITAEKVRELIGVSATIVGPGETLVVQVRGWNPRDIHDLQRYLNSQRLSFRVLVVPGDSLGVVEARGG